MEDAKEEIVFLDAPPILLPRSNAFIATAQEALKQQKTALFYDTYSDCELTMVQGENRLYMVFKYFYV